MTLPLKILILEDNESDAVLLERELKKSGFVFIAKVVQTREAFEQALNDFAPGIILSDYSLPSFDGLSAFHLAKKKSNAPFIIVSGVIGEENAVELIKNGITDYVLKDKLYSLTHKITRAIKESAEKNERTFTDAKIKHQNEKLFEIAFLQSHQVRVPIAHILGLIGLFKFDEPSDPLNLEVLQNLKISAVELDKIIHEIVKKTSEIKDTVSILP